MKNFKKFVALSLALVMALATTSAALAETTVDISNVTNPASGLVVAGAGEGGSTLEVIKATVSGTASQYTVVIADANAAKSTLAASDILYINQGAANADFWSNMGVIEALSDELDDGEQVPTDYVVRVGNDAGTYCEATISVLATEEGVPSVTVLWGDVNLSGAVNASDGAAIVSALAGGTKTYEDYTVNKVFIGDKLWGDINLSGTVNASDGAAIVSALAGGTKTYEGCTINKEATIQ